jgi:hypothetical protein
MGLYAKESTYKHKYKNNLAVINLVNQVFIRKKRTQFGLVISQML